MQTQTPTMQSQSFDNKASIDPQLFIKMVLDAWETYNNRFNKLFDGLTDEQLFTDVAPGRNSGVYLAGHLIAVHDAMLPLLGFGEKLYPELEKIFLSSPDKSGHEMPSISDLKKYRDEVNAKLSSHINAMKPEDWFTKHSAVAAEDFAKEPHRNKLNLLLNRTNHLSYHLGQLAFLVKKN